MNTSTHWLSTISSFIKRCKPSTERYAHIWAFVAGLLATVALHPSKTKMESTITRTKSYEPSAINSAA